MLLAYSLLRLDEVECRPPSHSISETSNLTFLLLILSLLQSLNLFLFKMLRLDVLELILCAIFKFFALLAGYLLFTGL